MIRLKVHYKDSDPLCYILDAAINYGEGHIEDIATKSITILYEINDLYQIHV